MANGKARSPNACGTHSATIRSPAITPNIATRTEPSSGSTTLVSQAYADHAHHSIASTSSPRARPAQCGSATISAVHWVKPSTKTRSKNNSSGFTDSRSRSSALSRGRCPDRRMLHLIDGSYPAW